LKTRPRFGVVSAVVTILAVFGGLAQLLRPYLPPAPSNPALSKEPGFVQQGAKERIAWQPLTDSAFDLAKHLQKPVLLVVGAEWSKDGRVADRLPFSDPEIANLIDKNFVPVRVDLDASPEWMNGFFPLSRYTNVGVLQGFQAFFLTPEGKIYDVVPAALLDAQSDSVNVAQTLLNGRNIMPHPGQTANVSQYDHQNLVDINLLMGSNPNSTVDFAAEIASLQSATDKDHGGFPVDGYQTLRPNAWLLELRLGKIDLVAQGLNPVLKSPIVDWLDGGFFRASAQVDWKAVEFDKLAVQNADMLRCLSLYALSSHSSKAAWIAHGTFDSLVGEFVHDRGLVSATRIGDEGYIGRSGRSSFSMPDLRGFLNTGILSDADRQWAVKHLGLSLDVNPLLNVSISDERVFKRGDKTLSRVLNDLRQAKQNEPRTFSYPGYADVNGFVSARLIEAARLWGDSNRMERALAIRNALDLFRNGNAVSHALKPVISQAELTDYLGYSDAALQDFLATGNSESLRSGLNVLLQAKHLFELKTAGAWLMGKGSPQGLPKEYLAPQILDDLYESCTAREIRLMNAYGQLFGGSPAMKMVDDELLRGARDATSHFSQVVSSDRVLTAGLFCAALDVIDNRFAVTVGPEAQKLADELFRLVPTRLIAPAVGPVRQDLQRKAEGIYVVSSSSVEGPLTLEVAARKLGSFTVAKDLVGH
jgi:uncharacterized protein YyaL (SSP411 family)